MNTYLNKENKTSVNFHFMFDLFLQRNKFPSIKSEFFLEYQQFIVATDMVLWCWQ